MIQTKISKENLIKKVPCFNRSEKRQLSEIIQKLYSVKRWETIKFGQRFNDLM